MSIMLNSVAGELTDELKAFAPEIGVLAQIILYYGMLFFHLAWKLRKWLIMMAAENNN